MPNISLVQKPANLVLRKPTDFPASGSHAFSRPFLLDDIDAYLHALQADPAPLMSDGESVLITYHRKVGRLLFSLPHAPRSGFEGEARARAAWWVIDAFGLAVFRFRASGARKSRMAVVGPEGEAWLASSCERKLDRLLARVPCGRRKPYTLQERFSWVGHLDTIPFPYAALNARVFEWMDAAVADLAGIEGFADFDAWITRAASHGNPFLADAGADADAEGRWRRWAASPQIAYAFLLQRYLGRLCSLGAVALAADGQGNLGVSLTPIGRYLVGLSDNWEMPVEKFRRIAMVGADFSIVLLEDSPVLALELSAFALREGEGAAPGTVFRLTRGSVQAGVHRGLSGEGMLGLLQACAKKGIPANVAHEIKDWASSKRSVTLSESILVEAEDPILLAEILSRFPKDFVRVAPGTLKYLGGGKRAALEKRLAKRGFFTD